MSIMDSLDGLESSQMTMIGGSCCFLIWYVIAFILFNSPYSLTVNCGQSCAVALFVLALIPTFFGGMALNFVIWPIIGILTCKNVCRTEDSGVLLCIMVLPAFGMFGCMVWLSSPGGYVYQLQELQAEPSLTVSICDVDRWSGHRGWIFTIDGSFSPDGAASALATIEHCQWHKENKKPGYWKSCQVGFAPILSCKSSRRLDGPLISFNSCGQTVCAWAVSYGSIPKMLDDCGKQGVGGLCGLSATYHEVLPTGTNCAGDNAEVGQSWDEGCKDYVSELKGAFSAAALAANISVSPDAPIFEIKHPGDTIAELEMFYSAFIAVAVGYIPLPALLVSCCMCLTGLKWRVFPGD
eukprot:TRINITY_DN7116_c0_g1_i2.p1 TRINITY_DN7116_c0_g1~~TRINITY_DN7116_c0_g1_i2.p1  ORF type:complete len:352 (-),score=21.80 TRINITY_DN7116_c0_g1_i2:201-1256(-)